MSHQLAIDDAAWSSRWRGRALADKALLSVGLVVCALVLPAWPGCVLVAGAVVVSVVALAGVPVGLLARSMRLPAAFLVLGAASVAVTVGSGPGLSAAVTTTSLARAAEVLGHGVAGTLAVLLLALTTPMLDILDGLRRLRVPAACVEVAGLIYRMLFLLLESVGTIRESQTARLGYSGYRRSMSSAAMLTAAVLTRSWERARRLEDGLAGRTLTDDVATHEPARPSSPAFVVATLLLLAGTVLASYVVPELGAG